MPAKKKNVELAVIGSNNFARALSVLAAKANTGVILCGEGTNGAKAKPLNSKDLITLPRSVKISHDLEEACNSAPLLVLATPSLNIRRVVRSIGDHLTGDQMIVHSTKGLEFSDGKLKRMSEVIAEECCVRKIGVISGPNFVGEMAAGQPSATVVGAAFGEVVSTVQKTFTTKYFQVFGNNDIAGVELGGSLKRAYAIACGIARQFGYGPSIYALIASRGLAEMSRIGSSIGARPATFAGLSGIGDLFASVASEQSPGFQFGLALGRGLKTAAALKTVYDGFEGVSTVAAACRHARKKRIATPILFGVNDIIEGKRSAKDTVKRLIALDAGNELDRTIDSAMVTGQVLITMPKGGEGKF
jgi:glycerol-3-phosphate dehydrogenase (NAD(P)+)